MKKIKKTLLVFLAMALVLGMLSGCSDSGNKASEKKKAEKAVKVSAFSGENESKMPDFKPQVKEYKVEKGLKNVIGVKKDAISSKLFPLIEKNGFAVDLKWEYIPEFFILYEEYRYKKIANFVTSDSAIHNYHLYFDYLLQNIEKEYLYKKLKTLTTEMLGNSVKQYETLKDSEYKNAATRNVAFFAVAANLLGIDATYPKEIEPLVDKEVGAVEKHEGIADSAIFNIEKKEQAVKEDYSQYIPRGHYAKDSKLKDYFKAMMWYGRGSFLKENASDMHSVILMAMAMNDGDKAAELWGQIYDVTTFFAGESDDAGMAEASSVIEEIFGDIPDTKEFKTVSEKVEKTVAKLKKAEGNKINSIPIEEDQDLEASTNAFRFMGQRYSIDADIMQNLIYRKVGENSKGEKRMLPKSLDIAAAFGSSTAEEILKSSGDYDYKNYKENLEKMKDKIKEIPEETWNSDLYKGWLNFLTPLLDKAEEGYPSFMRNDAWNKKQLNTFISSWTELKHDTVLYSKQVMAEMGGGGGDEKYDDRGYVEPVPVLYHRVAGLCKRTISGLKQLGMLNKKDEKNLKIMKEMFEKLRDISIKELQNEKLSDKEYDFIRSYGGQLEHFWTETLDEKSKGDYSYARLNNQAPLVSDVATDPNGTILQEGNGEIKKIFAVVPVEGKLKLVFGGVFSNYEFKYPMNKRLTDDQWRDMLNHLESVGIKNHDWISDYAIEAGYDD